MSTPNRSAADGHVRTAAVPPPRKPVEPPAAQHDDHPQDTGYQEPPGVFARRPWLIPVTAVVSVVVVFVAMVLLTWLAGGTTPFDR